MDFSFLSCTVSDTRKVITLHAAIGLKFLVLPPSLMPVIPMSSPHTSTISKSSKRDI